MKKSIMILIMATAGFFSSAQSSKSTQDSVYTGNSDSTYTGNSDSTRGLQGTKPSTNRHEKKCYTRYEYSEFNSARVIIQNSFPKSGVHYTDPNGKKYAYAVFWTEIINETTDPLELTIDFPSESFEFPPSSGNYFKLLLPSDTLTYDKVPLYDYGLVIKSFLDNNRHKSSSLKRTIEPNGSTSFYVVTLSDRGVEGTLRTGLSKKGKDLFYTIANYTPTSASSLVNDKEIYCGKIDY